MISILIPVFNRNVVQLVTELHSQLDAVKEDPEIIVMDDGSPDADLKKINREALTNLSLVNYIELSVNTGRNIIRHKLAAAAKHETLIFLDADSGFPDTRWLKRYVESMTEKDIIMGGRLYPSLPRGASSLHLHYGQLREQRAALRRNKSPYRSFLACNFLISKKQFSRLIVDGHLQGYCHEDTFMGLQFEHLNMPVTHIDNPVYHNGIDDDLLFMKKQREALENLHYLYHTYRTQYNFDGGIKLIRVYNLLLHAPGGKWVLDKLSNMEEYVRKNTLLTYRLFWLDCWKLAVYHQLSKSEFT